jgi:hypothetical protein
MLTREQRRQLEAEWSTDDRSMAKFARLLKASVLVVVFVGLACIAGTGERRDEGPQAAAVNPASATRMEGDGSAMRASRQAYDERRAQWEGKPAQPLQRAASR